MSNPPNRGAPLLVLSDLAFAYGERVLFEGLSFSLYAGDKVGLIGDNGVGKSTLLKLIAWRDQLKPLRGDIAIRGGARIGVLDQVPELPRDATIGDVLAQGLGSLIDTIAEWETAIANLDPKADALLSRIEISGGFDYQHKIDAIHEELDLPPLSRTIGTLSGGQMKRVAIGRLVLEAPDIVLYDEPTNHLDVETIEWLERYIADSSAAALVVTHDRAFLDTAVTVMAELRGGRRLTGAEAERGALAVYPGSYEDYLEARAVEEEQRAALGQSKAQLLKGELEWSRRQPKARTTKSHARLDRFAALKDEVAGLREKARVADFDFGQGAKRLAKSVLALENATFGYGEPLARDLDLALIRGERLGVVGRNGIGKTSLLKVLAGELALMAGHREQGPETEIATFDQHRMVLDDKLSIQRVVAPDGNDTVFPGGKPMHVAAWLARFAFSARHLPMAVASLSGGERNRLALARFLLTPANVMLLDEPTNDLDLQTLAILEEAVLGFGGTVVVVSHDRWFLDRVATRLMVFEDLPPATLDGEPTRRVHIQPGGWSTYRRLRAPEVELAWAEHKDALKARDKAQRVVAAPPSTPKAGLSGAEKKELAALEKRIEAADEKKAKLEVELAAPEVWSGDGKRGRELTADKERLDTELASMMARWETLAERAP